MRALAVGLVSHARYLLARSSTAIGSSQNYGTQTKRRSEKEKEEGPRVKEE